MNYLFLLLSITFSTIAMADSIIHDSCVVSKMAVGNSQIDKSEVIKILEMNGYIFDEEVTNGISIKVSVDTMYKQSQFQARVVGHTNQSTEFVLENASVGLYNAIGSAMDELRIMFSFGHDRKIEIKNLKEDKIIYKINERVLGSIDEYYEYEEETFNATYAVPNCQLN